MAALRFYFMEILIIGGLFVALMVFVSTRIKRSAAKAYEPEMIENEEFTIEKPEGFLHPLRDPPDFPFEAYSKTYGERSTRNIWRARTRLRITDGSNLKKHVEEIKKGIEKIESKKTLDDLPPGQAGVIVRSTKTENEIDYKVLRKVVQSKTRNKIYELKTTIMEPYGEEFTDKACEFMRKFVVK